MKPIAIDLGRNYWVMARMDAYGQPEVASVGEGGQIPAVISEYGGELLLGQRVSEEGGLPPLQDFFRLLGDDPEMLHLLQGRVRDNGAGETELHIGGDWHTASGLLSHMLHYLVPLVRDPNSTEPDVPVVVAIPPGLTPKVLYLLRKAVDESGFRLLTWCTIPQALVYCDPQLAQVEHALVMTMHVEAGSLTMGLVEVERGFPILHHHKSLEWAHDFPLPVGQVGPLLHDFLEEIEAQFNIHSSQIEQLLLAGEGAWLGHLQGVAGEVLNCEYKPFQRPHFAVSMGASILAGWMQEGLLLTPPPEVTGDMNLTLHGFTTPGTMLHVRSEIDQYEMEVGLEGMVQAPVSLVASQDNTLELTLERADGQRFAYRMNVHQEGGSGFDVEAVQEEEEVVVEVSTQPDLEVPDEMLQSGSEFGITPSPALELADLEEEGEEITSGEGGIETRIVSRETLFKGDFSMDERLAVQDVLTSSGEYELITTGQFEGLVEEESTGQFDDLDVVEESDDSVAHEEVVETELVDILEEVSLDDYYDESLETGDKTPPQEMEGVGEYLSSTDDALLQDADNLEIVEEVQEVDDLDVIEVTDDVVEEVEPVEAQVVDLSDSAQVVMEVMDMDSADHSDLLMDSVDEVVEGVAGIEESAEVNLEEVTMDPLFSEEDEASVREELRNTTPSSLSTNTELDSLEHTPDELPAASEQLLETAHSGASLQDTAVPQQSGIEELEDDDEMLSLRADLESMPPLETEDGSLPTTDALPQMETLDEDVEEVADALIEEAVDAIEEDILEQFEASAAVEELADEVAAEIVAEMVEDAVEEVMDAVEDVIEDAVVEELQAVAEEEMADELIEQVLEDASEDMADIVDDAMSEMAEAIDAALMDAEGEEGLEDVELSDEELEENGRIPFSEELELPEEGFSDVASAVDSLDELAALAEARKASIASHLQEEREELFPAEEEVVEEVAAPDPAELASKARERLERHKQRQSLQNTAVSANPANSFSPESLAERLERARLLAEEARGLLEEVYACSDLMEEWLSPALMGWLGEQEGESREAMARREVRKLLELAETLNAVESNRLPSSSRKSLARLTREVQTEFDSGNAEQTHHLALQLANRMFDIIRRDLRPW